MLRYFRDFIGTDIHWFKIHYNKFGYNHKIYKSLNHGRAILENAAQIKAYKAYYGELHYWKFISCFEKFYDNFSDELSTKDISIIDWGCGIGIGCWLLLEKGEINQHFIKNLKYITLIDFGMFVLNNAYMRLRHIQPRKTDYDFSRVEITKLKADLTINASLNFENISNNKKCHIHIFGNILDIEEINRKNIFNNITKKLKGDNYFICTSPTSTGGAREGISDFYRLFEKKYKNLKLIINDIQTVKASYHNYKMNIEQKKNTTQYLSIFKVNIK